MKKLILLFAWTLDLLVTVSHLDHNHLFQWLSSIHRKTLHSHHVVQMNLFMQLFKFKILLILQFIIKCSKTLLRLSKHTHLKAWSKESHSVLFVLNSTLNLREITTSLHNGYTTTIHLTSKRLIWLVIAMNQHLILVMTKKCSSHLLTLESVQSNRFQSRMIQEFHFNMNGKSQTNTRTKSNLILKKLICFQMKNVKLLLLSQL